LLCGFEKLIGFLIFGAIFGPVPFTIAKTTNLGLATPAFSILSPTFLANIVRFNPLTTASSGTIYSVLSRIFLELSIPSFLKIYIEQLVDMLEGYIVGSTALGRHMLWIGN
jgi:hypothetical protein